MADEVNITPEMIENLVNMLKNNNGNYNQNNFGNNSVESDSSNNGNESGQSDFSSNANSDDSTRSSENFGNGFNFNGLNLGRLDFETIMKLKSVMDSMNSNNSADSQLLYSLKPYLRKSRQDKLDQYINLLKISKVAGIFK